MTKVENQINLFPYAHSFPIKIDKTRNGRWKDMLSSQEKKSLAAFIEEHYHEIKSLKYADTTIY